MPGSISLRAGNRAMGDIQQREGALRLVNIVAFDSVL